MENRKNKKYKILQVEYDSLCCCTKPGFFRFSDVVDPYNQYGGVNLESVVMKSDEESARHLRSQVAGV